MGTSMVKENYNSIKMTTEVFIVYFIGAMEKTLIENLKEGTEMEMIERSKRLVVGRSNEIKRSMLEAWMLERMQK